MIYQDNHTFYHDRPTQNGEPSSNNGFIYTAYSKYLAPDTTSQKAIEQRFENCMVQYSPLKVDRLPGKIEPPISKDEIIGMVSLGLLNARILEKSHWNYCNVRDYEPKPLSIGRVFRAVKSLWKIRKEHRNYVWENDMKEAYCLAYYLMPQHRYYVKKMSGVKPNLLERLAFYINSIIVFTKGKRYSKMILWLECEDLNHWLLRFINKKRWVKDYFDKEHPFVKGLI